MNDKTKAIAKTTFLASFIAFTATAFSSFSETITAVDQNIGLAFGAVTGLSSIALLQLEILEEVQK